MTFNTRQHLKPISMFLYYPLDNNYSYHTWFKSTLHSLVNYAQHRESIYFPIYTDFFLFLFFTTELESWLQLPIYWSCSISLSSLFCFFLALRGKHYKEPLGANTVTCCTSAFLVFTFCLVAKTCEKGIGHQTVRWLHMLIKQTWSFLLWLVLLIMVAQCI